MKKLHTIPLTLLMLLMASCAFAGNQIDIPNWFYYYHSDTNNRSHFFGITNRSEHSVTINLSLYDGDGELLTIPLAYERNGKNVDVSGPKVPVNMKVTIPPKGQRFIRLYNPNYRGSYIGSGYLSWEYTDETVTDRRPAEKPISVHSNTYYINGKDGEAHTLVYLEKDGDIWF